MTFNSSHCKSPLRPFCTFVSALVLLPLLVTGCTQDQVSTVIKDVAIYTQQAEPILVALLPIITAFSASSADASAAASLNSFATVAEADLHALNDLCTTYLASPNTTVYAKVETSVDKLVAETDNSLLQVMAIKDPQTRQRVQIGMASFDALMHTIDGLIQTTESAQTIATKARSRSVKLEQVASHWSTRDRALISKALHMDYSFVVSIEEAQGF